MTEEQPTIPETSEPVPAEAQEQTATDADAAPLIAKDTTTATTKTVSLPPHQPLNAKWTLWFDNPKLAPAGSDWKENLKQCGSFDSVELFWRVFNNLKPASQLSMNSNYSVFRYGVEPSWEDKANVNGGKFVLTIPKKDSKNGKCDEWWLYTVLAVVGETMDVSGDEVNGAVVSIRKNQDRIALWLKGSERDVCVQIAERWKKALNLEKQTVRYQTHKDAAASGRSFRNEIVFEV
jgi:translation initiation factor 4E